MCLPDGRKHGRPCLTGVNLCNQVAQKGGELAAHATIYLQLIIYISHCFKVCEGAGEWPRSPSEKDLELQRLADMVPDK